MKSTLIGGTAALLLGTAVACSGNVDTTPGGEGAGSTTPTTTPTTPTTTATTSTTTITTSTTTTTIPSDDCEALAEAIADNMTGTETCAATLRLSSSMSVIGFSVTCAPYGAVGEAEAKIIAQQSTPAQPSWETLGGPMSSDDWIFWNPPSDFGGTGVVAQQNGLPVFGATTIWGGKGQIVYPEAWLPASAAGPGCGKAGYGFSTGRGFDLASGQPLPLAQIQGVLVAASNTALPYGLSKKAYIFSTVLLHYAPIAGVGPGPDDDSEWIVLINTGWLE